VSASLVVDGAVARLTLERPEALNALDRASADGLEQGLEGLERDRDVSVVIVTGRGRAPVQGALQQERGAGVTSAPSPSWLVLKFWQNTQRRLHQPKKIVPDPFQPRRQSSSPKCGNALATRANRPLLHTPILLLNRSISQSRGQTRHDRSDSTACPARSWRSPSSKART
jgi:hypothetical protein